MGKLENKRLEDIAQNSLYGFGVNEQTIKYCYKVFKRFLNKGSVLELGPAEGVMTNLLINDFSDVTVVEGSEIFCNNLKNKYPSIKVENSLFECYKPDRKFKNIILGHILEHVLDPHLLLKNCRDWLDDNGVVLVAVPNSRSIHRQAAVIINLLDNEDTLNEMDIHHGHRRIYNPEMFRYEFKKSGLKIDYFGGFWLKPISNIQIEKYWTDDMVNSFMMLGERYPDIAAMIYIIASK
ncbi:MAG TPA: class I SAM-dependent methyltransferase [Ignavibacteria bacterium]